jgi:hypothetical protein
MKTSILTQLVENLATVSRFIPERELLIERVVGETLRSLRKLVNDYQGNLMTEIAGGRQIDTLAMLTNREETKELLTKFAEQAMDFLDHVKETEDIAAQTKGELAN